MTGFRRTWAVVALAGAGLLGGCGDQTPVPSGTLPTVTPIATASPTPTPSAPMPIVDDCLSGRWVLDVEDYEGQAAGWLKGVGIPIEGLEMTGGQRLDLTDGFLAVSSDLTTTATLMGREISWSDASSGGGDVEFADGTFSVTGFSWQVRPEVPPAGAPSVPATDWSRPVAWSCVGDTLELRGEGAPLTARFVRP